MRWLLSLLFRRRPAIAPMEDAPLWQRMAKLSMARAHRKGALR